MLKTIATAYKKKPTIAPCVSIANNIVNRPQNYDAKNANNWIAIPVIASQFKNFGPLRTYTTAANTTAATTTTASDVIQQQPRRKKPERFIEVSREDGKRHRFTKDELLNGPTLRDFMNKSRDRELFESASATVHKAFIPPYMTESEVKDTLRGQKVYIETYGCQMNVSDSEVIWGVMKNAGFEQAEQAEDADVVFLNTCAIRENAEHKIWVRLSQLKALKKQNKKHKPLVGVLGCMAERLKTKLLEEDAVVDIVAGPDAYRDLPRLLNVAQTGDAAINTILSVDETYADIAPVRLSQDSTTAFVSIMRGCDNMCSYCIVPFTRGRERSRPVESIEDEVRRLSEEGCKEITLLGQNVNSYLYQPPVQDAEATDIITPPIVKGFKTVYKPKKFTNGLVRFVDLVDRVSSIDPEMRIRFTSPHPKDFPDDLLTLINERPNVCKFIHMPAQSGSTSVLERMRRGYTREAYLELAHRIREIIPGVALSSDFISGFCGETEQEHQDTLSLIEEVKYEHAFMFAYSLREKTHAHRNYKDDVPQEVKLRRLQEVINTFRKNATLRNMEEVGKVHLVLVEGAARRNPDDLSGRTGSNKRVVIKDNHVPTGLLRTDDSSRSEIKAGEYVAVKITGCSGTSTLFGEPIAKTTITEFHSFDWNNFLVNDAAVQQQQQAARRAAAEMLD